MKKNPSTWVVDGIGQCLTLNPTTPGDPLGIVRNAAIAISKSRIEWVGPREKLPSQFHSSEAVEVKGALVSPGLVDCHTHLIFAGSRADEFFMRLSGDSYEAIAKRGGGIAKTVTATREASDEELISATRTRLDRFLGFGVTTVEIKSGYALSTEGEVRLLRLIGDLDHDVETIPTFLGAHIVPKEFQSNRKEYIRMVCDEMLPQVAAEKLAGLCDVFCDEQTFTNTEAREILVRASELGLKTKIHADQLRHSCGAELAAELGALSADHLEHVSEAGIQDMAKKNVIGVLLPGAVFSLGKKTYPPARAMIERGMRVALSTDCNPGTSYSENLPLMMSLAAIELKMSSEEIWSSVTLNAAMALGLNDRGKVAEGFRADLAVWNADDARAVPYHYGAIQPTAVVSKGKWIQTA